MFLTSDTYQVRSPGQPATERYCYDEIAFRNDTRGNRFIEGYQNGRGSGIAVGKEVHKKPVRGYSENACDFVNDIRIRLMTDKTLDVVYIHVSILEELKDDLGTLVHGKVKYIDAFHLEKRRPGINHFCKRQHRSPCGNADGIAAASVCPQTGMKNSFGRGVACLKEYGPGTV
jgi:hypothetical protein